MRTFVLLAWLAVGAVSVFPEGPVTSASRTTESVPLPPDIKESPLLTQEQVVGWVKIWQRRLALSEWKIEAKIVRVSDLPKGTVANIHWSLPRRQATIKVMHPMDSTLPESAIVRDTELSVVHELIHLSMAKLPLDSNNTDLEEEAVKKISTALLAAYGTVEAEN
jgi:hypothetical protein